MNDAKINSILPDTLSEDRTMSCISRLFVACILFSIALASVAISEPLTKEEGTGTGYQPYDGTWYVKYEEYWKPTGTSCVSGTLQSPIKIDSVALKPSPSPVTFLVNRDVKIQSVVDNHTFRFDVAQEGYAYVNVVPGKGRIGRGQTSSVRPRMTFEGGEYRLMQFHFHHPSEHLLDGKRYPMEMHLLHMKGETAQAVVAVFLEIDDAQPDPVDYFKAHFSKDNEEVPFSFVGKTVDTAVKTQRVTLKSGISLIIDLLPPAGKRTYVHYEGSLTTPTCTEKVAWFVMTQPLKVSQAFVAKFMKAFPMNARWPQTLNERTLTSGTSSGSDRYPPKDR